LVPVPGSLHVDAKTFRRVLGILGAPHCQVTSEDVEVLEARLLYGGNNVFRTVLLSLNILLDPVLLVDRLRELGIGVNELNDAVGLAWPIDKLALEEHAIRETLAVVLLVRKLTIELGNIRPQPLGNTCLGPGATNLLFGELDELDTEAQHVVKTLALPEQLLEVIIVIKCACLIPAAEPRIERSGHLVLDLMAKANEETKVISRIFVDGGAALVQAALQFPVLERSMFCADESATLIALPKVPIFDALGPVVRMKKVGPCDDHQHDERLGLERDLRVVERADGCQRGFTRLGDELGLYRANCSSSLGQSNPSSG